MMSQEIEDEIRSTAIGLKKVENRAEAWQDVAMEALEVLQRLKDVLKPGDASETRESDLGEPRLFLMRLGQLSAELTEAASRETRLRGTGRNAELTVCAEDVTVGSMVVFVASSYIDTGNAEGSGSERVFEAFVEYGPETPVAERRRFVVKVPHDSRTIDGQPNVILGHILSIEDTSDVSLCTIKVLSPATFRTAAQTAALAAVESKILLDKAIEADRLLAMEKQNQEEDKRRAEKREARILSGVSFID